MGSTAARRARLPLPDGWVAPVVPIWSRPGWSWRWVPPIVIAPPPAAPPVILPPLPPEPPITVRTVRGTIPPAAR